MCIIEYGKCVHMGEKVHENDKGKLIATISMAAVIILLAGSIGSYLIANSVVNKKVKELQSEKARETAEEMSGWLSGQIAWVQENANTYELKMQRGIL